MKGVAYMSFLKQNMFLYVCCLPFFVLASSNNAADSLFVAEAIEKAKLARAAGDYPLALETLNLALYQADKLSNEEGTLKILIQTAVLRHMLNDYDIALELLFRAEDLSDKLSDREAQAEVYNNIGAIYHTQREFGKAADYYNQSLDIYLQLDKKEEMGRAYNNFGVLWQDQSEPEKAIKYHRKSLSIWHDLDQKRWLRIANLHLGVCYKLKNQPDSAIIFLNKSSESIDKVEEQQILSLIYAELGGVYIYKEQFNTAIKQCKQGLNLASGSINNQLKNCQCLYRAHEKLGNDREALKYYKQYATFRDSAHNDDKAKEMTRIEMDHQFERKQIADSVRRSQQQQLLDLKHQEELANERADRNIALGAGMGILLLAGGLWSRLRYVRKAQRTIKKERDRSDQLLLNILPAEIARELKRDGVAQAKRYEQATILFTDFEHFTATAAQMPATELVEEINTCFTEFDNICDRHNIEKIKTIGDAYMAAGGIPVPDPQATAQVAKAALEMQQFMKVRAKHRTRLGLPSFKMRAGIHVGPIVAGIVGIRKFQYDIWGDTVNMASRMESHGQVGRVNISQETYELLKNDPDLVFQQRGKIAAKGKGEVEMWFVKFNPDKDTDFENAASS